MTTDLSVYSNPVCKLTSGISFSHFHSSILKENLSSIQPFSFPGVFSPFHSRVRSLAATLWSLVYLLPGPFDLASLLIDLSLTQLWWIKLSASIPGPSTSYVTLVQQETEKFSQPIPDSSTGPADGHFALIMDVLFCRNSVQMKSDMWGQIGDKIKHCQDINRTTY